MNERNLNMGKCKYIVINPSRHNRKEINCGKMNIEIHLSI